MDQIKTGALIRTLRLKRGMTQLALAEMIGVSGKAVSKWECGGGAPDISLLPALAEALGVSARALLRGELDENGRTNGDLKKLLFYRCPTCGNLLFSTDGAEINCCGQTLAPLVPREPDTAHALTVEVSDGEWFLTAPHEMRREHHVAFVAFLTGDTLIVKRLYPEWDLQARLPFISHGTLLWYCTRHGFFTQGV